MLRYFIVLNAIEIVPTWLITSSKDHVSAHNVLVLIFSTRLAISAAVNLPVESSSPLSLTSLYQPNPGHSECYCTDSASWTIPGFVREDCQDATVRMYVTEVVLHDKEKFKFMA